jgi:hypothetical protein
MELMQTLDRELSRPRFRQLPASRRDHIGRHVDAIDVKSLGRERHQKPSSSASKIEHRLTELPDRGPVVVELVRLGDVELSPPPRDQPVVPGPGLPVHARKIDQALRLDLSPLLGRDRWRSLTVIAPRVAVVLGVLLLAAACRLAGSPSTCNAQIDWVNFIQVGSTQYVAGPQSPTVLQVSDLGPIVTHVNFKVSGNICDPSYRSKDGDAAFLDPGTPIYQVKGQAPSVQLAAKFDNQYLAYRAMTPAS